MSGARAIEDDDEGLGVFAPAVWSWSRMIALASPDARSDVFRNCADEGAAFVKKGAPVESITAALIERAERHDLVEALGGLDGVKRTIADAFAKPEPEPLPPEPEPPAESASPIDREIGRLAKLPLLEYERKRKGAAERLGVRASILDKLVEGERAKLGLAEADAKPGHAVSFAEPELWPEPVDGGKLFDAISKAIGSHIVMPEHSRDAAALWAAHTFLLDCTMISPRLAITSPTRGCGKTTALDVISQLVLRPLAAANISASSVFRVVAQCRPTLLVDEADSFLKDNEELRGILNAGHRRGGSVLRTVSVGDDFEVRSFSTYGPCAIALIGQLPGTLADRSVTITLTRRKHDEAITPFRLDRVEHLVRLARQLARWTKDNETAIARVEPEMPAGLYNRAADNWRPLLAIATVAGGDWLTRGHAAALAGVAADVDEGSRLELLLADIKAAVGDQEKVTSAELVAALVATEGRPWAEHGRTGKPLTANQLARLLKPLSVAPGTIRTGPGADDTAKGYRLNQFAEAFERYLPAEGGSKPSHRHSADKMGTTDLFQTVTPKNDVTVGKREKPSNDGLCVGVSDREGGPGGERVCAQCGGLPDERDRLAAYPAQANGHAVVWLHRLCAAFWLRANRPED